MASLDSAGRQAQMDFFEDLLSRNSGTIEFLKKCGIDVLSPNLKTPIQINEIDSVRKNFLQSSSLRVSCHKNIDSNLSKSLNISSLYLYDSIIFYTFQSLTKIVYSPKDAALDIFYGAFRLNEKVIDPID